MIDTRFWFKELFLCYKFAEKARFEKAYKMLKPYLKPKDVIDDVLDDILNNSSWSNH